MTKIRILPPSFYKYFWEIDPKSLDIQKYRFYVISRLLEFGDIKACKFVVSHFQKKDILKVVNKSREVSGRTRNFWQFYYVCSNTSKASFLDEGLLKLKRRSRNLS